MLASNTLVFLTHYKQVGLWHGSTAFPPPHSSALDPIGSRSLVVLVAAQGDRVVGRGQRGVQAGDLGGSADQKDPPVEENGCGRMYTLQCSHRVDVC